MKYTLPTPSFNPEVYYNPDIFLVEFKHGNGSHSLTPGTWVDHALVIECEPGSIVATCHRRRDWPALFLPFRYYDAMPHGNLRELKNIEEAEALWKLRFGGKEHAPVLPGAVVTSVDASEGGVHVEFSLPGDRKFYDFDLSPLGQVLVAGGLGDFGWAVLSGPCIVQPGTLLPAR